MRALRASWPPLFLLMVVCSPSPAEATHRTDLASAFDDGDPYDFNLKVGFRRQLKRGSIRRELTGTLGGILMAKEFRFTHIQNVLHLRADAAIWKDLQLHVEFPIIVSDTRYLDFAQNGGDACGDKCVNKHNSQAAKDKLLPNWGKDMGDSQVGIAAPDKQQGGYEWPSRSGLDQFHLGIQWAPINQLRDNTKPTWVLGFEARLGVGSTMRYNPNDPTANKSVGQGVHQLHFFTMISRRSPYLDPYMGFFYMMPIPQDDSLYEETAFPLSGQERAGPLQRGGVVTGMEIIPWEQPHKDHKVSIEISTMLEGVFEGRGYSDVWELFANNPSMAGPCAPMDAQGKAKGTADKFWNNGNYCSGTGDKYGNTIPHPGITRIENHAIFTTMLAFNFEFTKYFRGQVGGSLGYEQQHYITFGDAGRSLDDRPGIQYDNPQEVDPMYRPNTDSVGRRFRTGETTIFDFFASVQGRF